MAVDPRVALVAFAAGFAVCALVSKARTGDCGCGQRKSFLRGIVSR